MRVSNVEQPRDQAAREARLLERLRAGEEAAFADLVRLHLPRMQSVVRRMLAAPDVDDVLQETFLSAFRALPGFRGQARLSTWLHRIAINAALMHLRARQPMHERPIDDFLPRFLDDGHQQSPPAAVWDQTAADLLGRAETRDLVRAAIDTLPQIYRVVLVLRDIEELDTGETAALLEVGPGVVKTRLHRARQALRTIIEQKLQETAA